MAFNELTDWAPTPENINRLFEFSLRSSSITAGVVDGAEFTFSGSFLVVGPHTTIGPEGEALDGWEAHPLTPRDTQTTVNDLNNESITLDVSQYAGSTVYVTVRPSRRCLRNFIQTGRIEIIPNLGARPVEGPLNLSVVLGTVTVDAGGQVTGVDAGEGSLVPERREIQTGSGGGFTPTAWGYEGGFLNIDTDANDGFTGVPIPGVSVYDPKKEYAVLVAFAVPGNFTGQPGVVTVDSFIPGLNDIYGFGQITDTVNGVVPLAPTAVGGLFTGSDTIISSGGLIGPAANTAGVAWIGPNVVGDFNGGAVGLDVTTGTFVKDWEGNGSGFDSLYLVLSRQVVA